MQNHLSSNLDLAVPFRFRFAPKRNIMRCYSISMDKNSSRPVTRAFTLIELLVVFAAIDILLGIAVPPLNSAYERAKITKDMSNLRQIGLGMQSKH
ncbi:MAG TPA: hypothetical protein VIS53_03520 [Candidatus Udaeobacter sp.]